MLFVCCCFCLFVFSLLGGVGGEGYAGITMSLCLYSANPSLFKNLFSPIALRPMYVCVFVYVCVCMCVCLCMCAQI